MTRCPKCRCRHFKRWWSDSYGWLTQCRRCGRYEGWEMAA